MRSLISLLALTFYLLSANAAFADTQRDLQRAQKTLAKNDFDKAFKQFSAIKHPLAFFTLGLMEDLGMGRVADRPKACRWYAKSAEGLIPTGIVRHANCLRDGVLGKPDPTASAHWYGVAVEQGYHAAACLLGRQYMQGEGVPENKAKALQLCEQAANSGSPDATLQLADWYADDSSEIYDQTKSMRWYYVAAEKGIARAQHQFGMLVLNGRVEQMPPTESLPWLEKAAAQGYADSYLPVAVHYWTHRSAEYPDSPPPEALAKAYLWTSAAAQTSANDQASTEIKTLLAEINALMPAEWKASLDEKLNAHLQKHHVAGGE